MKIKIFVSLTTLLGLFLSFKGPNCLANAGQSLSLEPQILWASLHLWGFLWYSLYLFQEFLMNRSRLVGIILLIGFSYGTSATMGTASILEFRCSYCWIAWVLNCIICVVLAYVVMKDWKPFWCQD